MSEGAPRRDIRGFRASRCGDCRLPLGLCVCADLPTLAVRTRLLVVLHPREAISSSNTGRLAARMLEGALVRARARDAAAPTPPLPEGRRLTLFPREGARVLGPEDALGDPVVLMVPDGTWPAARRMMGRDRDLASGEIVTLPPAGESRYRLRCSAREGALCTLEAIAVAMGILEGEHVKSALLAALDRFVARGMMAQAGRLSL